MIDTHGRLIDYIRISVTDRCNLRCVYCMPEDGVLWMPHAQILTFEEILGICSILSRLGIRKIKITGGEPLTRKGVVGLIRSLKSLQGIEQVTMTSNGVLLNEYLPALKDAGLDALNISLDTLNADNFYKLTLCGGLEKVKASLISAVSLNIPVKVNCVPIHELNYSELSQIAALARDNDIAVRFIELMPLGRGGSFRSVSNDEVFALLEQEYGKLTPYARKLGNGPATYYTAQGFLGKIGFISALSHEFCSRCNRVRLTSDGFMKPCLHDSAGLDIKAMMRGGAADDEIERSVIKLVSKKPLRHHFARVGDNEDDEQRDMFRIGG